jgi:hypothetical protein
MRARSRVNYDVIAHLYDGQPYRRKTVDPELVTFIAQHASPDRLSLLDVACGTGSQLVANRPIVPDARLVGLAEHARLVRQMMKAELTAYGWNVSWRMEAQPRCEPTTFACSPFGGISSTQYRLIGMACSRRNLVSGERMAATQRRVFAADLLLMQQTQIIDSNWGCSSGATRIVGDFRTDAGSHRGPIKLV